MVIEVVDYTKTIKKITVLNHVSARFESGVIYGLRGENGSGKTMLMRAICGLIKPTSGYVSIDGEVVGKDISFPRSIGVLIETPAFIDEYTGFENLQMIARIKKVIGDSEIKEALEEVGLNPDDRRSFKKYSLGMRQRLGIACALMEWPDILLLDEPLNGLDPKGAELALEAIHKRANKGALVIMACHDAQELDSFADEVLVMERGAIVG